MILSTLCYIERDGQYLMLHRVKKNKDANAGKWIGIGGKLEHDESPDECIAREVLEETGLTLLHPRMRGVISFILPRWENEITFLYTAEALGDITVQCEEGELRWVKLHHIPELDLWPGDRIFLPLLWKNAPFFSLKLTYDTQDALICAALDGKPLPCDLFGGNA